MLTKQYEKIVKLFQVFVFLLITLIGIVLVGLITRDYSAYTLPQTLTTDPINSILQDSCQHKAILSSIAKSIHEIRNAIIESQENSRTVNEIGREPTIHEIYAAYAEVIVDLIYPGLDSDYVKAIIYRESRYDPNAYNVTTGATGLMQISPKWHTQRAKNLGVNDLYDPYGNVLVGCDILNEVMEKSGSFEYAINFFAGGYPYANAYRNSKSPYMQELEDIIPTLDRLISSLGNRMEATKND